MLNRVCFYLGCVLLSFVGLRCGTVAAHRASSSLDPIPLTSGQPSYSDFIKGRLVVLDLWASWCDPCKRAIPRLNRLHEAYSPDRLLVVGLNLGEASGPVDRFVHEAQIKYPIYLDPDFRFADGLGETKIPRILLIGRDGEILHRAESLDVILKAAQLN